MGLLTRAQSFQCRFPKESFTGRGWGPLTPLRQTRTQEKMAECELTLRQESKVIGLCRLAVLRLGSGLRLLVSFRGKFLCHGLLQFLRIDSVAFGGVHENVVAAGVGALLCKRIRRQQLGV
jgi:hypothetical protein